MDEIEDIGLDYATTLRLWHEAWCEKEDQIKACDPVRYDQVPAPVPPYFGPHHTANGWRVTSDRCPSTASGD
jgi:hypothetical protein